MVLLLCGAAARHGHDPRSTLSRRVQPDSSAADDASRDVHLGQEVSKAEFATQAAAEFAEEV